MKIQKVQFKSPIHMGNAYIPRDYVDSKTRIDDSNVEIALVQGDQFVSISVVKTKLTMLIPMSSVLCVIAG